MNVYFHTFGCKANQYDTELVLTEDYLPVYLPVAGWDGSPRFAVTVQ